MVRRGALSGNILLRQGNILKVTFKNNVIENVTEKTQ